jgi:hypothetical protein
MAVAAARDGQHKKKNKQLRPRSGRPGLVDHVRAFTYRRISVRVRMTLRALGLLALFAGLPGCSGSSGVTVTCEVAKAGQPYTAPPDQTVQITFYALEANGEDGKPIAKNEPYAAAPTGDGKYEVPGPDGRSIPPGKYRISIVQTPKTGATAPRPGSKRNAPDRDHDYLKDQFGPVSSPIVRTVDRSAHLVLDLDRPAE